MNFPNLQITDYGSAAIIAAIYEDTALTFTGIVLGDGTLPAGTRIKGMSAVISPKKTLQFDSCTTSDNVATLVFTLQLSGISSSFYLRELGVMASIDDGETSSLYAYTNAGSEAILVKPDTSGNHANIVFTLHVAVGDAENVTAIISEVTGYVTDEEFEDHLTDYNNPHHVTKAQVGLGNVPNLAPSNMTVTFTASSSLDDITSGSTLSALFAKVAKAISTLKAHLTANNNPHNVTLAQIGAAAASHTHAASAITSGVLGTARGGTGVGSLQDLNTALGDGFATCSTAAATAAKTAALTGYTLTIGGRVSVRFANDVPANATLNINSKGAKAIYKNGAAVTAGMIVAGDICTFVYDGSFYQLVAIDRSTATIAETKSYLGIS